VALDFPPIGPVDLPKAQWPASACSIPRNLDEAHDVLGRLLAADLLAAFKTAEESEVGGYNGSIGIWLRNSWGLWNGGPLRDHFRSLGLSHPDDMSALVLITFWRHLNERPLRAEEEAARLREADEGGAPRFRPACRCFQIGRCVTSQIIDRTPGSDRAVEVSGCCCGAIPQIGEGKPIFNPQTNGYFVFPSHYAFGDRVCGPSFGA
jgi:hypothetical protein